MVINQTKTDPSLMAHLLKRAGFGSDFIELKKYVSKSYEDVVEDLIHPEKFPEVEEELIARYYTS